MKYCTSILLILFLSANSISQPVENASITIDRNMMSRSAGTSLQGKWMFKFESGPETLQEVPKSWIYYSKNNENLPSTGTGVYKIQIINPERISNLALLFYGVSVEYKVLINEKLIHRSKGYLTTNESDGVPARSRVLIPIPDNHETIDLTIEVSNEVHSDGGLTKAPVLGLISKLEPNEINRSNFEMVQIGCLLLMAVYNLILFFQFKNSSYIYLSLLCFIVLIRGLIVFDGSLMLYSIFTDMSYSLSKRIEYFVVYSTIFIPPLFLESLFKDYHYRKINYGLTAIGALLMLIVLATPTHIFTATLNFYHLMMLPSFAMVFVIVFRAIKRKKVGAKIVSLGILISFGFTTVEIMINSGLVELYHGGPNLVNTGTVVFLFVQTIVISKVFAHYREESIQKSIELTKMELEKKNIEKELEEKEKELADYTLNMIQRNRLLEEMETIISETKQKESPSVGMVIHKFGRLINLNRQSNSQWEDFNRYFGNVHHDFFNKLKEKFPDVSGNDLRHCALIKMNLSLKESAEILGVDVGSVKVARYRMKRKMGLGEEDDLKQIIISI